MEKWKERKNGMRKPTYECVTRIQVGSGGVVVGGGGVE